MSEVYVVDGWDLNFFIRVHEYGDPRWVIDAYPYDAEGNWIGKYMYWLNIDLSDDEIKALKLGDPVNEYSKDDDFWAGADWFVQSYPYRSVSVDVKINALPERVKFVDNKLVRVDDEEI